MTAVQWSFIGALSVVIGLIVWLQRRQQGSPLPGVLSPLAQALKDEYDLASERQKLDDLANTLAKTFPQEIFTRKPVLYPPMSDGNQAAYLRELVKDAATRYRLNLYRLHVRFSKSLPANTCGAIRQDGAAVYVDFADAYRDDDSALTAIVGHEMAHLALWTQGLGRGHTKSDEELADTLAVLVGYGPVMLSAGYLELGSWRNAKTYEGAAYRMGYLHPLAIGYYTLRHAQSSGIADLFAFAHSCSVWAEHAYPYLG